MQTTLRLDDDLYRRAKARSAELGISLTRFLAGALERRLEADETPKSLVYELPVSTARGAVMTPEEFRQRAGEAQLEDDLARLRRHGLA